MFRKTFTKLKDMLLLPSIWKTRRKEFIEVLYKSENFVVVNKPCNIYPYKYDKKVEEMFLKTRDYASLEISTHFNLMEPCRPPLKERLPGTVDYYLRWKYPEIVNHYDLHFASRLDFSVSGVMCISLARSGSARMVLASQKQKIGKYYIAILKGHIEEEVFYVDLPLDQITLRDLRTARLIAQHCFKPKPKLALSKFLVLERGFCFGLPATKVLVQIYTGRRHQIRAHAASINHAIIGDFVYSRQEDQVAPRILLHSLRFKFDDAVEPLDISTEDPFTEENSAIQWRTCELATKLENSAYAKLSFLPNEIAQAAESLETCMKTCFREQTPSDSQHLAKLRASQL